MTATRGSLLRRADAPSPICPPLFIFFSGGGGEVVKEKMKILRWECPVCKKEIYSLWREQLDWLKRTHLLRHKREKEALGKNRSV